MGARVEKKLKTVFKAKANAMLLEAARAGWAYLLPKLLDKGIPIPHVDLDAVALPDLFADPEGLEAERDAPLGVHTRSFVAVHTLHSIFPSVRFSCVSGGWGGMGMQSHCGTVGVYSLSFGAVVLLSGIVRVLSR